MLTVFLVIVHVSVCLFLMLVVLLQQGKSGGMGSAFGGGATQQVFGGRGAGNLLTRATATCAGIFMVTSVCLAYVSSSGDRALKERIIQEHRKGAGNEGTRVRETKPKPAAPAEAPAPPSNEGPSPTPVESPVPGSQAPETPPPNGQ
jgi:preprotein translocase subunit SecG